MTYINTLLEAGTSQVIIIVAALLFFTEGLLKTTDWLLTRLGIKTKTQIEKETIQEAVKKHDEELSEIKNSLQEISQNLKGDTRQDEVIEGLLALLRQALYDAYNKWSEKGYCPIYAMETSEKIYEQYHALGGNDVGTELFERLKELPTQPQNIKDNKFMKEV